MLPYFVNEYKIVLIDFIFQGQSDKDGEFKNFDEHAEDVISLMQFLQLPKAVVCGISYGSLVAQNLSVNYPLAVEKLILLSTLRTNQNTLKPLNCRGKEQLKWAVTICC